MRLVFSCFFVLSIVSFVRLLLFSMFLSVYLLYLASSCLRFMIGSRLFSDLLYSRSAGLFLFVVIGFVYLPLWVVFILFWSVRFESKPSGFLVLFWSVRFESKPSGSLVLFWSVRFESKPSGFSFYSLLSVRFESKPSGFGP